ncbi:hypothetical protein CRG49_000690 [Neisseria sp. N95_16]|uniref:Uncharacterized protein n=1 Tax=Neisseria brasiliensis TaxID=2666100 RepID=A0A7X2GZ10_9NEIS|nr:MULTISPECIES: hypothetical protein [Neisseria]MRN38591.1 hypothetical protein [Neisseria brasiliensis]PJO10768.1 hypothetical protein CRG49_000690 [Neisseria sp. N95_16]
MQELKQEAQDLYHKIQALEKALRAELWAEAKQLGVTPLSNHLAYNSAYMKLVDIMINLDLCNSPNITEPELKIRFATFKPLALAALEEHA